MSLPRGPIGFRVHMIGYEAGNPTVIADVAAGGTTENGVKFKKVLTKWFIYVENGHRVILDKEESGFLEEIWVEECQKKGLPLYNAGKEG